MRKISRFLVDIRAHSVNFSSGLPKTFGRILSKNSKFPRGCLKDKSCNFMNLVIVFKTGKLMETNQYKLIGIMN
jgi:hypothetical protein